LVAAVDRLSTRIRRLARRLSAQAGFALVLSIGSLSILTMGGMSVVVYTTSNAGNASHSTSNEFAFSLSEAGLNNALAVLANPANNALDPDTLPSTEATASSLQYEGGTAEWWGVLGLTTAVWTVNALGLYDNPTGHGAAQIRRKLTAKVPVTPVAPQDLAANNQAWQYMVPPARATSAT
jgi:Tfp pilus assembly protein PilX